jgi:hypothetical protein
VLLLVDVKGFGLKSLLWFHIFYLYQGAPNCHLAGSRSIENILGEGNLNRFVVPVGIVLLVILFVLVAI